MGTTGTIEGDYREFRQQNPNVYALMRTFARQMKDRGFAHGSISLITERVRWEVMLNTADPASDFKINNNYRSRFARDLNEEPGLEGFFHLRALRSY